MGRLKNFAGRIIDATFSPTAAKVVLIFLMLVNVAGAVSYGIEGDVKGTWNCINWIMWVGIVLGYQILMEHTMKRLDLQKDYIEAHEIYHEKAEDQIKTQRDLISAQKDYIRELEEKAEVKTGQYKSKKDSRF